MVNFQKNAIGLWIIVNLKNDWVLFLDADEYLTEQFIKEVSEKIIGKIRIVVTGYIITISLCLKSKNMA